MITKRCWEKELKHRRGPYKGYNSGRVVQREGWFLFGFIPLYIRDITLRRSDVK